MKSNKNWRPLSVSVWHYLIEHRDNKSLFFHDVAREVGISLRHLNYPLAYVLEFCERQSLPPLTGIVLIKQETVRLQRECPSAHFRLKHQGQFYYPCDASFEALYQQKLAQVRRFDWQAIHYAPSSLTVFELKSQWLEAKKQRATGTPHAHRLNQLARR